MTALAADPRAPFTAPDGKSDNRQIANTAIMYHAAAAALGTPTHATAASRGRVFPWTGGAGQFLLGLWDQGKTTGDTSANPIVNGQVGIDDRFIGPVPVAGLASSEFQRDVLKLVYLGDDNMPASLTLTRPAAPNDRPIGIVWQGYSATEAIILWFGAKSRLIASVLGANAGGTETLLLGSIGVGLTASGDLLTGITMGFHGKFLSVYAICVIGPTDADVDIDANLEIATVNVTGGVIELVTADVAGANKAGTAITANNEFHAGDAVDVEGVVNTAGTVSDPGLYNLYATVERLPGV